MTSSISATDLVSFSQLRWDFVFQRPNHLMTRAAEERRVWFVEEPVRNDDGPRLGVEERLPNLRIVRPFVPRAWAGEDVDAAVDVMLVELAETEGIRDPIAWFWTPMAVPWARSLSPSVTVYDCMDELSAFRFAPPALRALEEELLEEADVVFTGGASLFEAKRGRHPNVHLFPSAVDSAHFGRARSVTPASDQATIPHPAIGWVGVIDERMDLDLVAGCAELRPDWSFVFIGPIVKIDPETFPRRANIHLLGPRPYAELPAYIAGWDVAMMPFARNEATRFISPTKTLEYLAAGVPVVSTSIRDVVEPFSRLGLVRIADTAQAFVEGIEASLAQDLPTFGAAAARFVAGRDWDATWRRMSELLDDALRRSQAPARPPIPASRAPRSIGEIDAEPAKSGSR